MNDAIDFERETARFTKKETRYIVDVLRGAYEIAIADAYDHTMPNVLVDLIDALNDGCNIEIGQ